MASKARDLSRRGHRAMAAAMTEDNITKTHVGLGNVANIDLSNVTNESKATMFSAPTFTGTTHMGNLEMTESGNYWHTSSNGYANSGVWSAEIYFTNGVSNQYVDIIASTNTFWTAGVLRLHSTYSHANQSGYNRRFDWAYCRIGASSYANSFQENTPGGMGVASSHFSVSQWAYDSGNSRHYMRISKGASQGNSAYIQLYLDQNAVTYLPLISLGSLST